MASSNAMQLISASPLNQFLPSACAPHLPQKIAFRVRSMGEKNQKGGKVEVDAPLPTISSPTPKLKVPLVQNNLSSIFAFNGPVPERINGRLAMVGFVTSIGIEIVNGQDLFSQVSNGGIPWLLGTSIVLSIASLVPLLKGVTPESKSGGLMTSYAEIWNGRFAMLGFISLAFTEFVKGGALV